MFKLFLPIVILTLFSLESLQVPISPKADINYQLRISLFRTRTTGRRHWAFEFNREDSRDAVQIDMIPSRENSNSWQPREIPTASLDSDSLAGSIVLGTLTVAQYNSLKQNIESRFQGIRDGDFTDCRDFILSVLEWCTEEEQRFITQEVYQTWKVYRSLQPMQLLQEVSKVLDISQSPWGKISKSDIDNKFNDDAINKQMVEMFTKHIRLKDTKGLEEYLRINQIDPGDPSLLVPLDDWVTAAKKYFVDVIKAAVQARRQTLPKSSSVIDSIASQEKEAVEMGSSTGPRKNVEDTPNIKPILPATNEEHRTTGLSPEDRPRVRV